MKRLLSLFCATVVMLSVKPPAFGVAPTPPPSVERINVDKNGIVQPISTTKPITFPNGVVVNSTNLGITKTIHIAFRTDSASLTCVQNICGSGTPLDPYDGSTTVKFDSVMKGLATNTTVRIGKGTFLTSGSLSYNLTNGYFLPAGTKIIGAGMYDTIIRQSAYPVAAGGAGHYIFEQGNSVDGDGTEVTDLTLDCNWNNVKSSLTPVGSDYDAKTGGVVLSGNNCKIKRVRCINAYGNVHFLREAFPLYIHSHIAGGVAQDCKGAEISDTDSELFQGDYGIAVSIVSYLSGAPGGMSGAIFNNRVYNWNGSGAYQAEGNDIEIYGNRAVNCKNAFYFDTGNLINVRIHDNIFLDCIIRGIQLSPSNADIAHPAVVKNVVISNNIVEVNRTYTASSPVAIGVGADVYGQVFNVSIIRNMVLRGTTGTHPFQQGIDSGLANGLQVIGNTVDSGLQNYLNPDYPNTGVTKRGNLNELGAAAAGLEDSVLNIAEINVGNLTGNASLAQLIVQHATGDGSGLSNVSVDAANINEATRVLHGGSYTAISTDRVLDVDSRSAPQTIVLSNSTLFYDHVFYVKDTSGQAQIHPITLAPDMEGQTVTLNTNFEGIKVRSRSGVYSVVYRYIAP